MNQDGNKKKVLLIGAGGRARDVIMPALLALPANFELTGIIARSKRRLALPGDSGYAEVKDNFDDFDFRQIDIVIVAITLQNVPAVLAKLTRYPVSHITLMLDTPVLPHFGLRALKFLKKFKNTLVSEDNLFLPLIEKIKQDLKSDKIGRLKKIIFDQSGYRYHALAELRALSKAKFVKSIKVLKIGEHSRKRKILLSNSIRAEIIEPRDYRMGKIMVEGENGVVQYDLRDFPDMTQMKIEGLIRLLRERDAPSVGYSPIDAIYDNLCLKVSDKMGLFFDFKFGEKSAFYSLINFFA